MELSVTDLTSAARWWASKGVPVFPCRADKRPMTEHGFYDATTEITEEGLAGAELIAAPTGELSGLVVIDTDPPSGEDSLFDLQADNDDLPQTLTVRTARGGFHRYFKAWAGSRSSAGKLGPNIDTRGEGGYVILPPSPGYEIVDSSPPAEAPQWLRDKVTARPEPPQHVAEVDSQLSPEELEKGTKYAQTVVEREIARLDEMMKKAKADPRDYSGPPWDVTTFEVACNLQEVVNSPWNSLQIEEVYNAFLDHAPRDAMWGEEQIVEKWKSALNRVNRGGRPKPTFHDDGFGMFTDEGETRQGERVDPDSFFVKGEGLVADRLAQAVIEMGPLAIEDTSSRATWAYSGGVWRYAPLEVQDRCVKLLQGRFRPNHVTVIAPVIQRALLDRGQVITCEPVEGYINLRSGMLDWRSGVLMPHDPAHFSTVQLPVDWQPEAKCPHFDDFLEQVMAPDAIDYIWEVIGYLAYSGNPFQTAILFHGEGQNGKGTLMRVIEALLGSHNTSSVTLQDITEGRFETASLFGRIANLAGDIDPTYMKSTAKFKAVTGEDTIEAQRKYQDSFRFTCWATPVFSANKFWKSADTTSGYRRRWLLVAFPNTISKPITGLSNRLHSELPGILVKALAGLQRLMERGRFDPPASAQEAKTAFEVAADQVYEWLEDDAALVIANPTHLQVKTRSSAVYSAYRGWADMNGTGAVSAREFRMRMEGLGFAYRKVSVNYIHGIGLDLSRRLGSEPLEMMSMNGVSS